MLFLYISDLDNRNIYGRYLKEKHINRKIINCPIEYDNTLYEYDSDKQYTIVQHNTIDNFIKSPDDKLKISYKDQNIIKNMTSSQLLEVYSYIIEIINKG